MTLTTHSVVGGALAKALTINPVIAFAVGVAGHYLIDSLPHWEYNLCSAKLDPNDRMNDDMVLGRNFIFDLGKIGLDFLLGLLLAVLFFYDPSRPESLFVVLAGVAGGVMPDFLQFVYMKTRCEPFKTFQKLHDYFHTSLQLKTRPYLNIIIQTLVIFGAFVFGNFN